MVTLPRPETDPCPKSIPTPDPTPPDAPRGGSPGDRRDTTDGLTRVPDRTPSDRRDRPGSVTLIAGLGIVFGLVYLIGVPLGTFFGSMASDFPTPSEVDAGRDRAAVAGNNGAGGADGAGSGSVEGSPDTNPQDGIASVDRTGDATSPARTESDITGRTDERATTGAFTLGATIFGMLMGSAALMGGYGSLKLLPIARNAMNIWAAATIGFVIVGAIAAYFSATTTLTVVVATAVLVATLAYASAVLYVYSRPGVKAAFGGTGA